MTLAEQHAAAFAILGTLLGTLVAIGVLWVAYQVTERRREHRAARRARTRRVR